MTNTTIDEEAGRELTKTICEIIDDEMAHSADETWQFDRVAPKVAELLIERLGPETAGNINEHQAIVDALFGGPVGTNVRLDEAA